MRRVLIALAILAVTAQPSFAAGPSGMMQDPEVKSAVMRNPQHLLMMAYHKNMLNFGQTLARVARQGDTVPGELARAVVSEMRRSVEEMEKHRSASMAALPAEVKGRAAEMQRMMDEHLVEAKTELRQLEDLARRDRIPSQEVLKHLQFVSKGCQACGSMPGPANHCQGRNGEDPRCHGRKMGMMPSHQIMVEMMQKMKAQDAELLKQVDRMNSAPKDRKVDLVADIVTQLVKQRAEMTTRMENMQQMMHRHGAEQQGAYTDGAPMPPPPGTPMFREGEGPDDEEDADIDSGDADVYEMDDVTE